MLGRMKRKSNSKGWFFDLGFCLRGRSTSIFVPGASKFDNWSGFSEALRMLVGEQVDPLEGQRGLSHGGRAISLEGDREAGGGGDSGEVVRARVQNLCLECGRPWQGPPD